VSRTKRFLAGAYLLLLAASYAWRSVRPTPALSQGMHAAMVRVVDRDGLESRRIRLAYVDTAPGSSQLSPVVLVHGSPGSSEVFRQLTPMLSPHFRVIVPDLPGFGESTRDLPDYSFRAHAVYLLELLDALRLPKAQWVGFSMGGGVVLSVADMAPERVGSLVMLSAIGIQEDELTGSYRANHILHGALLGALWCLRASLPHFGGLDDFPFNVEFARNFYDSDQRPLRLILMRYHGPMLILHGTEDGHVPVAAAWEHHQLVPQSEMQILDDNHFIVFQRPWLIRERLEGFLNRFAGHPTL
jgi:pimeloyl-ACP methyl ester carboxylesterase